MKPEDLGRALDALAGEDPSVDDAYAKVSRRAHRDRLRVRVGALGVVVCVVALAAFGASRISDSPAKVIVQNPTSSTIAPIGDITDLTWTRIAAPYMTIHRIVAADGRTFAVGSTSKGRATIAELSPTGSITDIDPNMSYNLPRVSGSVHDLISVPGALIAVGNSASARGEVDGDAAWRSTDGGQTWQGVAVESPRRNSAINRVLVTRGVIYAIGGPDGSNTGPPGSGCPIPIWKSEDGTDFRRTMVPLPCDGAVDVAVGPSGLLLTQANATAWTEDSGVWSPHRLSDDSNTSWISAVAGDANGYVAVGYVTPGLLGSNESTGAIWWSSDGRTWSRVATASPPPDQGDRRAEMSSVVHNGAGWVAAGRRPHRDSSQSDLIVWTSTNGRDWHQSDRDDGVFEQYASAGGVGVTNEGFAMFGLANITGEGVQADPVAMDDVLWLGSNVKPDRPLGILQGTMIEVAATGPGRNRRLTGSLTATDGDGREFTATVTNGGRFSTELPPGTYNLTGQSPLFGDSKYDCSADGPATVRANTVAHAALVCSLD